MTTIKNLMGLGTPAGQASAICGMLKNSLTAAGTTQGNALQIPSDFSVFTTVASGTGAILPSATATDWYTVVNHGANTLLVYPPVGGTISTGATNAGFSVPTGKTAQFQAISAINFAASVSA